MTPPPTDDAAALPRSIQRRLRLTWRKERRFCHSRGVCYFLLWLVALILLDFLLDWLLLIPGYGRVALLVLNVATLAWIVYARWLRALHHYSEVRTALQVERRHPELQSLLVSYVQLGEEHHDPQASPALIRAFRRQTVEMTRPINFREIISFAELKRIFLFSLVTIAFFGVISINWSGHLRVLARRMFNPGATVGYPTRTQIDSITGDVTVRQGGPVTLVVRASGVVPDTGTLYVRAQGGSWERIGLTQGKDQHFSHHFSDVYENRDYYVRLGDARSDRFLITVVPPPRLVACRVHLKFPNYTGLGERTLAFPGTEDAPLLLADVLSPPPVPEGTQITWHLTSDTPLRSDTMTRRSTRFLIQCPNYPRQQGTEAPHEPPYYLDASTSTATDHKVTRGLPAAPDTTVISRVAYEASSVYRVAELVNRAVPTVRAWLQAYAPDIVLEPREAKPIQILEIIEDRALKPTHVGSEGSVLTHATKATQSFSYVFTWHERDHGYVYSSDDRYSVDVEADRWPQVELLKPSKDPEEPEPPATLQKTIALRFRAIDDYPLEKARIVYWIEKPKPEGQPAATTEPRRDQRPSVALAERIVEKEHAWKLNDPADDGLINELKIGDILVYAVEVADRYDGPGGPHRALSDKRRLKIVSVKDYLKYIAGKRKALRDTLLGLRTNEADASKEVKTLKDERPAPSRADEIPDR